MGDDFEDFEDDFDDDGDFMDDDSMEDGFDDDFGSDGSLDDGPEMEDDLTGDDMHDDEFTTEDAIFLGGAMGFAYEEGMEEAERRKLEKKMDADRDQRNNNS